MEYLSGLDVEICYIIDQDYESKDFSPDHTLEMELPPVDSTCITPAHTTSGGGTPPAGENAGHIYLEPAGDEGLDRVRGGLCAGWSLTASFLPPTDKQCRNLPQKENIAKENAKNRQFLSI